MQDHVDFGRLQLLGSLRYNAVKVHDVNPAYGVANDTSQTKALGRVGAVYALSPQLSAFAGWGQGMRVPTFAVFTQPPKPELSEQAELGLRINGSAGLSGTLAWFDLKLKNALAADPTHPGQTIQLNQESSRGFDLDLRWQLSTYTHALVSLTQQSTQVKDTGKRFVDVPKTSARIALHHDFGAASALPGLGLGLGLTHHSALAGDAANSFETPAATVFDAQLSYRVANATLGLVVRNATDKRYWVPSRYFGGGQVTPATPRSISAAARFAGGAFARRDRRLRRMRGARGVFALDFGGTRRHERHERRAERGGDRGVERVVGDVVRQCRHGMRRRNVRDRERAVRGWRGHRGVRDGVAGDDVPVDDRIGAGEQRRRDEQQAENVPGHGGLPVRRR